MTRPGESSSWYVHDVEGAHRGPLTTDALTAAIQAGEIAANAIVAPDRWFEAPGSSGWRPLGEFPELAQRLEETRRREQLKDRKMPPRLVEGAFTTTARGTPEFGATAMIIVGEPDGSND